MKSQQAIYKKNRKTYYQLLSLPCPQHDQAIHNNVETLSAFKCFSPPGKQTIVVTNQFTKSMFDILH